LKITFLMPCYPWSPMGGFKIVYQYANLLVERGHGVSIVHPLRLKYLPAEKLSLRGRIRRGWDRAQSLVIAPKIKWQWIDPRVKLRFVPDSDARHIPAGDALFASGWHTVNSVLACPPDRGERFYLIQGYETWQAEKEIVDATWRAPLHKVVIAKWLLEIGNQLGCSDMAYIPNAIDHRQYRLLNPLENRGNVVAMLYSSVPLKGSKDGFRALEIVRQSIPNLQVILFGTSRSSDLIPSWARYYRDPPQDFIVNNIYNQASVFVSPSLTEGYALPPAEAANCGCALAVTDSGGTRVYLEHGSTGLMSAPGDPESLARNILLLLQDADLRLRLVTGARKAIARLDWGGNTNKLEQYILERVSRDKLQATGTLS
jgi:glycosyltransferase involved in cell wall biosynthesis